jgi:hypothetical protein
MARYELYLEANDFLFVGRWVTPPLRDVSIRGFFWLPVRLSGTAGRPGSY